MQSSRFCSPHPPFPHQTSDIAVAVPVRDEAEHIGVCLRALAWQRDVRGHQAVLLVNNTTDGTVQAVRALAPSLPMAVHVIEREFTGAQASAGHARRCAMEEAAAIVGAGGVLLTTDADGRVASDWLSRNLHALSRGAEAVAGRALLAPEDHDRIPPHLHEADAQECAYGDALQEIASLLDPDPNDPWPRHAEDSGASLCVTAMAYARCGGVPDVPSGEDRALVAALRRCDTVVRHAPDVTVTVSGRIWGRAVGGMADTIRRRLVTPDRELDDRLEPIRDWARRHRRRAQSRIAWATRDPALIASLAQRLRLRAGPVREACLLPYFGMTWAVLEAASPVLARRRVPVVDLPREMGEAGRLLGQLRRAAPTAPALLDADAFPTAAAAATRTLRPDLPLDPATGTSRTAGRRASGTPSAG